MDWSHVRRTAVNWLLHLLLIVLIALILLPIAFMVITSFRGRTEITNPVAPLIPSERHVENYREMWDYVDFGPLYRNSIIVVGTATAIGTFVAAMAGYSLARFPFPGADAYSLTVMSTQLIPGTLFFIPLYLTFLWIRRTFGLPMTGHNFGAIVLYVGFFTPISIWILRGFFASLPPDLEEQAMVDGATRFQAFLRVSLPLALPGIVSTAIYIFMTAWEEMFFSYQLESTPSRRHSALRAGSRGYPTPLRLHGGRLGGHNHTPRPHVLPASEAFRQRPDGRCR